MADADGGEPPELDREEQDQHDRGDEGGDRGGDGGHDEDAGIRGAALETGDQTQADPESQDDQRCE